MSDATCKTCPWCRVYDHDVRHCHFNAPHPGDGADDTAFWPYVDSTDWCGEHPDRQPQPLFPEVKA